MSTFSSSSTKPKAIHFGAGNIGRGLVAPVLSSAYTVVFAGRHADVIDKLNDDNHYDVHVLDTDARKFAVEGVMGVNCTTDAIVRAIADPNAHILTTAVGPTSLEKIAPTIAQGLIRRREIGGDVMNIIACENLVGATSRLKEFVLSHLTSRVDQAWVAEYIGFADCSVDRIVPPFDPSRASSPTASAAASPISSPCPSPSLPLASSPSPPPSPSLEPILDVGVESFYEWVVDRTQLKEPLPLVKGWTLTKNLRAYNERKLYTLNTGHCIAAYLGYLKGVFTIDEAIADPEIEAAVRGALAESGTALCAKHGFTSAEHATYVDKTIRRFRNPNVCDDVVRVGRQPIRKLGRADRLVGPAMMCQSQGVPVQHLLVGIAAALLYDAQGDEQVDALAADVAAKGLAATIVDVTGFAADSAEVAGVLTAYAQLQSTRLASMVL